MMGTIDVATWTAEFIEEMHFGEVANYLIMPTLIENYGGVTFVNKDAWSSLPDEYKEAIEKAERIVHWEAHEYWRDQMEKNLTTLAQKHGYEVIWLPEEDVKEMTRLTIEEVWNKWADKSPRCAKGIQLVKQWYGIE
jgi:TRAP-type C4-dicarboxylate transport system substrate-binding protein